MDWGPFFLTPQCRPGAPLPRSSPGQGDAQIFTNDRSALANALGRDVSHQSAYQPQQAIAPAVVRDVVQTQEREFGPSIGMSLGM